MTTTITTNDILNLPIFKCKVCTLRLHNPIMHVEMLGSICGSCHSRRVYANTTPNVELESLLSKLYVSCRHVLDGCTFDGFYYKIWKHEKICSYREIFCPFGHEQKCEDFLCIKNMIGHIQKKHSDRVLLMETNRVLVFNPTKQCPSACYLLVINNAYFLLRTSLNMEKKHILYAFYHFNNDSPSRKDNFPFVVKYNNAVLKRKGGEDIRHVCEIVSMHSFDTLKFKSPKLKMESLNSLQMVEIYVGPKEEAQTSTGKCNENEEIFCKCSSCNKITSECYFCSHCVVMVCLSCKTLKHSHNLQSQHIPSNFSATPEYINLRTSKVLSTKFPCANLGCTQLIKGKEFDLHTNYLCNLKKNKCPFETTSRCQGDLLDLCKHTQHYHKNVINQSVKTVMPGSKSILYFINGNNFFLQEHNLTINGRFTVSTIKLTEPYYENSYIWEVHVKKKDSAHSLIIVSDCTIDGYRKTVFVKGYMDGENKLTFNTYIKQI